MRSVNPSATDVLAELEARIQDREYFGTISVVLRGGVVTQVRNDQVLAVSQRERKDNFNGNQKRF